MTSNLHCQYSEFERPGVKATTFTQLKMSACTDVSNLEITGRAASHRPSVPQILFLPLHSSNNLTSFCRNAERVAGLVTFQHMKVSSATENELIIPVFKRNTDFLVFTPYVL